MKKYIYFLLTAFFFMLLQFTLLTGLKFGYLTIDTITPFLVWWAIRTPMPMGLVATVAAGIIAEILSSIPTGLFIFAWSTGYLSTRYMAGHMAEPEIWQQTFMVAFVSMEITVILQTGSSAIELVWPWGILQALLNAMTAPIFFSIFNFATYTSRQSDAPA